MPYLCFFSGLFLVIIAMAAADPKPITTLPESLAESLRFALVLSNGELSHDMQFITMNAHLAQVVPPEHLRSAKELAGQVLANMHQNDKRSLKEVVRAYLDTSVVTVNNFATVINQSVTAAENYLAVNGSQKKSVISELMAELIDASVASPDTPLTAPEGGALKCLVSDTIDNIVGAYRGSFAAPFDPSPAEAAAHACCFAWLSRRRLHQAQHHRHRVGPPTHVHVTNVNRV